MRIHSLRTKFVLLFLLFFFLPFGILTFLSVSMSKEMMKQSTMAHLQNLVDVKSMAIEQWLRERVSDGKTMSESSEIKSLNPEKVTAYLNLVKHFYQAYVSLSVFDPKGHWVSTVPSQSSFENRAWFQKAVEQGLFISEPRPYDPSGKPVLSISFVIKDSTRLIGVLQETVDLAYVSQLLSEAKLGKTGELYLVDREGKFVIHKAIKGFSGEGISKVPYSENPSLQIAKTAVYKDYKGNEVLGAWKWISALQCYLIAEQDAKEAFSQTILLVKRACVILAVSALLIFFLSYWAIGTVTKPIGLLGEAVTSYAAGRFEKSVPADRKDEIGKLITGFNSMAEKLKKAHTELEGRVRASDSQLERAYETLKQRQEQLIRSEKMAALGQLSAGIAHEIRNPLTSVKIFIQSLEKEIDLDEPQTEDFRIIKKEIDRINEHITRFLDFARPEDPFFQRVDIRGLITDTLNLLTPKMRSGSVDLDISLPENLPPVEGDPKQLGQVLLNLILNAMEAMPQGGVLTIRSTVRPVSAGGEELLQLFFQDTGCGIPDKDKPYLYDPFFSTKEKGTGLGLSIVYSIIQKHNGQIEVKSELGKGSLFIISLPVLKEKPWKESSSSMTT